VQCSVSRGTTYLLFRFGLSSSEPSEMGVVLTFLAAARRGRSVSRPAPQSASPSNDSLALRFPLLGRGGTLSRPRECFISFGDLFTASTFILWAHVRSPRYYGNEKKE